MAVQPNDAFGSADELRPAPTMAGLAEFASSGLAATADPAELITLAVAALPSAKHACLTVIGPSERLRTLACSDPDAGVLDKLQDQMREGPGLDAVTRVDLVSFPDLSTGADWPQFSAAARKLGIGSLLSVRVPIEPLGVAALTFYAAATQAFSDADAEIGTVCGSFLGLMLRSARDRERAENLEIALESNRQIGTAVGVVMARDLLTADQAFDRLRAASQRLHRKLRDIADDVVATGQLPPEVAG